MNKRADNEAPFAINRWGWKFHHIGIPTNYKKKNEKYLSGFRMYVSGFSTSPYGIEWMRFEKGSTVPILIRKVPHIAFEVKNIEHEIKIHKLKVISPAGSPSEGVRSAMIEHDGAPVELIEFDFNKA